MSLLTQNTASPAQIAADQVRGIIKRQFIQLAQSGVQGFRIIWNNPQATPQDVIAALGTDAAAIFQLANLNIETVTTAAQIGGTTPPVLPTIPADYTLTFNGDGSATATKSQQSSSSSGQ